MISEPAARNRKPTCFFADFNFKKLSEKVASAGYSLIDPPNGAKFYAHLLPLVESFMKYYDGSYDKYMVLKCLRRCGLLEVLPLLLTRRPLATVSEAEAGIAGPDWA